jgi:hypothetical protein
MEITIDGPHTVVYVNDVPAGSVFKNHSNNDHRPIQGVTIKPLP